jgi:sulfite exporter TauE/SafE
VDSALIASATLLGLAGAPHCTVMCSAPCAAAAGRGAGAGAVFQVARLGGYALAGALAAASVSTLATWSQFSPALRPLWTLLHAMALVLGLWLLWQGRQPAWLERLGRVPPAGGASANVQAPVWRAATTGALWVAWPCGLLQSALLVAAMTGGALAGAAAMGGFALASAPGLVFGPWVWRRLLRSGRGAQRERWATRAAGLLLVVAAGWALGHGLWEQVAAFCSRL